jgi:hypothetical protein
MTRPGDLRQDTAKVVSTYAKDAGPPGTRPRPGVHRHLRSVNNELGAPVYCRECGKPLPHRRRQALPASAHLAILGTSWVIGIGILLLLSKHP